VPHFDGFQAGEEAALLLVQQTVGKRPMNPSFGARLAGRILVS
jgi:hypothetical protein